MTDQPVMGQHELAERLGVSKQRAWQIVRGSNFPKPYATLSSGPIWKTTQVERWIEKHRP